MAVDECRDPRWLSWWEANAPKKEKHVQTHTRNFT
ncbi:hypothetical protein SNOG_05096 [Parastagonospora nodorum SN15]|uniref:Uncharacterized protein n=1 Tax=Phaeosphaeria nodorum (strain SN15 / ATCC MYA-4574 / FGSC 10173) TaxID=321614 RepID=Q0UT18_PHANO|nr:hypothetical protein SNOG_05096 [Parastagonospora nodorum SN15]EAT87487.1 hypothetical protein SNOG_05096 [Parastagonospora nodorum SN15]